MHNQQTLYCFTLQSEQEAMVLLAFREWAAPCTQPARRSIKQANKVLLIGLNNDRQQSNRKESVTVPSNSKTITTALWM